METDQVEHSAQASKNLERDSYSPGKTQSNPVLVKVDSETKVVGEGMDSTKSGQQVTAVEKAPNTGSQGTIGTALVSPTLKETTRPEEEEEGEVMEVSQTGGVVGEQSSSIKGKKEKIPASSGWNNTKVKPL